MGVFNNTPVPKIQRLAPGGLYNWTPDKFPRSRFAMSQVRRGVRDMRVRIIANSTHVGEGAGTGSHGYIGARALNPVSRLVAQAPAALNFKSESFTFCNSNAIAGITLDQYDPRIALGGWSVQTYQSLGGLLLGASSSSQTVAMTPAKAFDHYDVFYLAQTGAALSVNVDGGTNTNFAAGGATVTPTKGTVSVTKGTHTINAISGGTSCFLMGVVPYDSTACGVEFINGSISGSTPEDFALAGSNWQPSNALALAAFPVDLEFICLTVNWANLGQSIATEVAKMTTIINARITAGSDVVLVIGTPFNAGGVANIPAVSAAVYALADQFGLPVLDLNARFASYAVSNPIWSWYDNLHPGRDAYDDMGAAYLYATTSIMAF